MCGQCFDTKIGTCDGHGTITQHLGDNDKENAVYKLKIKKENGMGVSYS